jgi:hypothetical protein
MSAPPRESRTKSPPITAWVVFLLLSLPAAARADGTTRETSTGLEISPDGHSAAIQPLHRTGPGALLLTNGEVPLPATPDWEGDLERAVGALAFGDVDNDGDLDLACGCYYANAYPPITDWKNLIYRNDSGTLETTPSWVSSDERHTADLRFGDVDGDGRQDLFAANGGEGLEPSVIYLNSASGTDNVPDWTAADATWTLGGAFGDVDGDGDLDLVTASQGNTVIPKRPVSVFRNLGSALETFPSWVSADSAISNAVGLADLDGSSVVTVNGYSWYADGIQRIFYLPHQPIETAHDVRIAGVAGLHYHATVDRLAARIAFDVPPPEATTVEVDYTYSTLPDIAFSRWVNYATCLYANTGAGFSSTPTWTTGDTGRSDKGLGWSDVDDDGDLDLAFGGTDASLLYRNDGGSLIGPVWSSVNSYHGCQDLAWGDVDGDGDDDLATIHFGNGHVRVYLNRDGDLDTSPSWVYDLSSSGTAIAWGDVDGDGRLDLAAGSARQPLVLFLNNGTDTGAPEIAGDGANESGRHPRVLALPNPFRDEVQLLWRAPGTVGEWPRAFVIVDAGGRVVRRLPARHEAGKSEALWDGRDELGRRAAAGVYFCRAEGGLSAGARPLVLLR